MPQLDWNSYSRQCVGAIARLFLSKEWTTLSCGGPRNKSGCSSSSTTVIKQYKFLYKLKWALFEADIANV